MQNKDFDSLTIQDDFIFQKVMLNPVICKKTLEKILDIKIDKIEYKPENEKNIRPTFSSKGIRMDVFLTDGSGTVFDIEMQVARHEEFYLPKRLRYYQSAIDVELLAAGQDYPELNKSYIIFICPFDEFGCGRHIYTFKNVCLEDKSIILADDAVKIILSTKGTLDDVSPDVLAFLRYVDGMDVSGNEFVNEIKTAVDEVKQKDEWRREYMLINSFYLDARRIGLKEGREEGRKEGIKEGRKEGHREGRKEGRKEGELTIIKNMKLAGIDTPTIAKVSGWSAEQIAAIN